MKDVKECRVCGKVKVMAEFAKSSKPTGSGYKAHCKVCAAKKLADWRSLNIDAARERDRKYANKNKDKISEKNKKRYTNLTLEEKFAQLIKTASKRTTFKCFITVEHLRDAWQRQGGLCAYTKLPLSSEAHQLNTVSLDRVDSDKDYTDDNIQLVCVPINRMKLDMTEDRFIELCSLVTKNSKLAELPVT